MQLPWALALQYLIFHEGMDLLSTLGASIIMGSTIWVVSTKQSSSKVDAESVVSVTPRPVRSFSLWTMLIFFLLEDGTKKLISGQALPL